MKPTNYDSLYDITYVEDVQISPDGSRASFVRLSIDRSTNEYQRTIWLQDLPNPTHLHSPLLRATKTAVRAGRKTARAWASYPNVMAKRKCT